MHNAPHVVTGSWSSLRSSSMAAGIPLVRILFRKSWTKLVGLAEGEKPKSRVFTLVAAFLACLLLSCALAHIVIWSDATALHAAPSRRRLLVGFMAPPLFTQHIFENRRANLFVINVSYWLLAMGFGGLCLRLSRLRRFSFRRVLRCWDGADFFSPNRPASSLPSQGPSAQVVKCLGDSTWDLFPQSLPRKCLQRLPLLPESVRAAPRVLLRLRAPHGDQTVKSTYDKIGYHHRPARLPQSAPMRRAFASGTSFLPLDRSSIQSAADRPGGIKEQTARTLENLKAILEARGSSLGQSGQGYGLS